MNSVRTIPPTGAAERSPEDRYDNGRAEAMLAELNDPEIDEERRNEIRNRLAELYAPLVRSIARRYAYRGEPQEDLEQSAYVGLVKAINNYDPDLSDRFVRYAFPVMRGEVRRHFRDKTWTIHMPRRYQELRARFQRTTQEFIRDNARSPTVAELAGLLGITEEETIEVMVASDAYSPASLDVPVHDEEGSAVLADTLGAEDGELQKIIDGESLAPLLDALPERERKVILLRFFGNKTQVEIAEQLGCSQMHVSRLLRRTLTHLREAMMSD